METIDIYHKDEQTIEIGDIVSETTSAFPYNGVSHCFDNEATTFTTVVAEFEYKDYSQYDSDKCRDGGAYGFDYYKVVDVITKNLTLIEKEIEGVEIKLVVNPHRSDNCAAGCPLLHIGSRVCLIYPVDTLTVIKAIATSNNLIWVKRGVSGHWCEKQIVEACEYYEEKFGLK